MRTREGGATRAGAEQTREAAATGERPSERGTKTDEARSGRRTNGMSGQRATNERDDETGERRRSDTGHAFGTRMSAATPGATPRATGPATRHRSP